MAGIFVAFLADDVLFAELFVAPFWIPARYGTTRVRDPATGEIGEATMWHFAEAPDNWDDEEHNDPLGRIEAMESATNVAGWRTAFAQIPKRKKFEGLPHPGDAAFEVVRISRDEHARVLRLPDDYDVPVLEALTKILAAPSKPRLASPRTVFEGLLRLRSAQTTSEYPSRRLRREQSPNLSISLSHH